MMYSVKVAALMSVAGSTASAMATTLPFSTGFEAGEGYTNGAQLSSNANWTGDGQDSSGWQITNTSIGGSGGATSSSQWILASSPTASTTRWQWTVAPVTDFSTYHAVCGSADVKLVNPSSGTVNRNTVAGLQMYTSSVFLMAQIDLHCDTQNLYGAGAGRMFVELEFGDGSGWAYDLGVSNAINQYINLGLAVDFTTDTVYGFVNGVQLPDTGSAGGASATDFHDFDMVTSRGSTTSAGTSHRAGFDNYSIMQCNIPAPASLVLMGVGGLAMGRRRR